jgi:hypothetical protein
MANRDIAGLLTGISSTQRPNPNMSSDQWRMAFGAQQGQNLSNAVGQASPDQAIQMGMGQLDLTSVKGLTTLAEMQQLRGDMAGAAKTASKIQAMKQAQATQDAKKDKWLAISEIVKKEIPNRPDLVDLAVLGNFEISDIPTFKKDPKAFAPLYLSSQENGTVANAVLSTDGTMYSNGTEISEQYLADNDLSITKTFVKKPSKGNVTNISTGDKIGVIQYKIDAETTGEFVEKANKEAAQFLPIVEDMLQVAGEAEFGAGTPMLASANNIITSAMQQLGMEVKGDSTGKNASLFFNANSKLLKQRLLEAQKGSISNMENTEITQNTANTGQPKQVALALLNSQKAAILSNANKASSQDSYLRRNQTIGGFEDAWKEYIEEFPRTAGYYVSNQKNKQTGKMERKVVDNFETVKGNMELFQELYSHKTTSAELRVSPVFSTKEGVTEDLKSLRKKHIETYADKIAEDAGLNEPTPAIMEAAKRKNRKVFGLYLKRLLDNGTLKVVK